MRVSFSGDGDTVGKLNLATQIVHQVRVVHLHVPKAILTQPISSARTAVVGNTQGLFECEPCEIFSTNSSNGATEFNSALPRDSSSMPLVQVQGSSIHAENHIVSILHPNRNSGAHFHCDFLSPHTMALHPFLIRQPFRISRHHLRISTSASFRLDLSLK